MHSMGATGSVFEAMYKDNHLLGINSFPMRDVSGPSGPWSNNIPPKNLK